MLNTIISGAFGIIGGACLGTMLVLFPCAFLDPVVFPRDQPRDESTIANLVRYSALCGAVIGLILVLGSGQRL